MILRSSRVVLPDGVGPADIHVADGTILRLARPEPVDGRARSGQVVTDLGDLVISPGIVDTHVHVNEPGRTDWEGFDTATRAAAAGGVTTIVDMPLNCIPATTTVEALEEKRAAARSKCHVDVAFWGGVVPGNASELDGLVDAGVRGFKCFLAPSGVEEFQHVDEDDLRVAMRILTRRDKPLLAHAEDPTVLSDVARALQARVGGPDRAAPQYATYLAMRPPEAEVRAIRILARLARELGTRVHVVHVASAEAAAEISRAKDDGVRLTAETCPHYLTFAADEVRDGATEFKCAPPIREARHRDALWSALEAATLDLVATDHSPSPPAMKRPGDFIQAWGGIASLELSLSAVWSGVAQRFSAAEAGLRACVTFLSEQPAALARLERKGRIAEGCDADFVVWDPDAEWTVDPSKLQQRHKLTPYAGRTLRGRVHGTYVRGVRVWDGERIDRAGTGELL